MREAPYQRLGRLLNTLNYHFRAITINRSGTSSFFVCRRTELVTRGPFKSAEPFLSHFPAHRRTSLSVTRFAGMVQPTT